MKEVILIQEAYNSLKPCDKLVVMAESEQIKKRLELTKWEARELLYKLGQWMNSNDKQP